MYTLNSLDSEVFIQARLPTAYLTSEEGGGGGPEEGRKNGARLPEGLYRDWLKTPF